MLMYYCYSLCYKPALEQFLRGAVICNKTPSHWNRSVFKAHLNQSNTLALVACVATDNWFQSCRLAQRLLASQSVCCSAWDTEIIRCRSSWPLMLHNFPNSNTNSVFCPLLVTSHLIQISSVRPLIFSCHVDQMSKVKSVSYSPFWHLNLCYFSTSAHQEHGNKNTTSK